MKTLMLIAFVLASQLSFGRILETENTFILNKVIVDQVETEFVAELTVNQRKKTIQVDIYRDICGSYSRIEGEIRCLAMPILLKRIETNIHDTETSCGSQIYSAGNNNLNHSGTQVELEVMNNSGRVCRDLRPGIIELRVKSLDLLTKKVTELELYKTY